MGRTGEGLNRRWLTRGQWVAVGIIVVWAIVAFILAYNYFSGGYGQAKAPETLATVTMTSPTDSTVQQLYEICFKVSDVAKAKNLKVEVTGPKDKIKGDKMVIGSETFWQPKATLMDPGLYTVMVSGKGIKDATFYFLIEKKEEQKKIEPPIVTPPPAPAPSVRSSEAAQKRKNDLEQLIKEYPVQPAKGGK